MTDDARDPDLVSLIDVKREWQSLLDSPQWGKLVEVLQAQVDELQQVLLRPLSSRDEVFVKEFQKGQLEGRLSITNTVETIIAELEVEIERKQNG
jgi:hypothetical protein